MSALSSPLLRFAAIRVDFAMTYPLVETLHVLFVVAWMAAVFYLPRILVNMAETAGQPPVQARLQLMGRRLYRFGHMMFGLAFVLGLALWQGWRVFPAALPNVVGPTHWIDAKVTLVILLLIYFIFCGRMLKRAAAGGSLPSPKALRWTNELPVLLLLGVLYLAIAKPF